MTDIDIGSHLFTDVEASGLGPTSYPIEIGWAYLDGKTGSVLIRPAAGWTYWDEEAELLHCISRAELAEKGLTASAASRLVAEPFAGRILVSDSPGWDERWLAMLFCQRRREMEPLRRSKREPLGGCGWGKWEGGPIGPPSHFRPAIFLR